MVKKELKLLISKNKTQKAIQKLLSLTEVVNDNDELFDEAILISSRYESFLTAKRAGAFSYSEEQIQINRINNSILDIIQRLPDSIAEISPLNSIKKEDNVIELFINQNFDDFNSTRKENLIGVISAILNIQRQDVIIRQIVRGSVKILIEMPKEKAVSLIEIFKLGTSATILKDTLKIKSITSKGSFYILNTLHFKIFFLITLFTASFYFLTNGSILDSFFAAKFHSFDAIGWVVSENSIGLDVELVAENTRHRVSLSESGHFIFYDIPDVDSLTLIISEFGSDTSGIVNSIKKTYYKKEYPPLVKGVRNFGEISIERKVEGWLPDLNNMININNTTIFKRDDNTIQVKQDSN